MTYYDLLFDIITITGQILEIYENMVLWLLRNCLSLLNERLDPRAWMGLLSNYVKFVGFCWIENILLEEDTVGNTVFYCFKIQLEVMQNEGDMLFFLIDIRINMT